MISVEVIWRLIRGSIATAVVQTLALNVDWSNLHSAERTIIISLTTGFLLALSKAIRDQWGNNDPSRGIVNKIPV